jgi:hypothetical protein
MVFIRIINEHHFTSTIITTGIIIIIKKIEETYFRFFEIKQMVNTLFRLMITMLQIENIDIHLNI